MSYYLGYDIDSPSTVGGSGSVNAHLRLMTSQLDTISNKSASTTTDTDRAASGTIFTAGGTVALATPGCGSALVALKTTNNWNGTLAFQIQGGDGNWQAISAFNPNTGALVTSFSTSGTTALLQLNTAGATQVEVIAASWVSGSGQVTINASAASVGYPALTDSTGRFIAVGPVASGMTYTGAGIDLVGGIDSGNIVRPMLTDNTGRVVMTGAAAAGAAVAGNPVLGGMWDGTNVQYLKASDTTHNELKVSLQNLGVAAVVTSHTVDGSGAQNGLVVWNNPAKYNSTTWDFDRNNIDATLLSSASRTILQTSADITTYNTHSIMVTLDVTSVISGSVSGSVTLSINYKDPASGKYIPLLTGALVAGISTNMYLINPNIPAVANVTAQKDLGRVIQILVTPTNANPVTYSCGYTLVS